MSNAVVPPPGSVVVEKVSSVVVTRARCGTTVVTPQIAPGAVVLVRGIPGPAGDAGGALLVVNQLSEFNTEPKRAAARANLGLAVIDGGTFF